MRMVMISMGGWPRLQCLSVARVPVCGQGGLRCLSVARVAYGACL